MTISTTDSPKFENGASQKPFRILALDGGGIRGYYTARLLTGLLKHFEISTGRSNLDLGKGFDLICGTSTGGILGAALAHGLRPERIAALYKEKGPSIFPKKFPKVGLNLNALWWGLTHIQRPSASVEVLRSALESIFQKATLNELWEKRKIALTIPAVSIESYGPKVFKTPHIERFTHDRNVKMSDVCLATSAAPLYFPLHKLGTDNNYFRNDYFVDGGLWANNPSLVGLLEAVEILKYRKESRPVHIFSLGTCAGKIDQSHLKDNPRGGLATWNAGKDITELALITSANAMNFMTRLLANTLSSTTGNIAYARIPDPEMTPEQQASLGMDRADARAFEVMEQLAATNETRILAEVENRNEPMYQLFAEIFRNLPECTE